jgi:hypothetical protein
VTDKLDTATGWFNKGLNIARLIDSALAVYNAITGKLKAAVPPTLNFSRRWGVFFILLPSQVILCVLGYALFAKLDPRIAVDNPFAFLAELPAMAAYAACAIAFTVFVKLLAWHDIPRDAENTLHQRAAAGDPGARWLLIKDRIEWLVLLIIFIAFFWPSR